MVGCTNTTDLTSAHVCVRARAHACARDGEGRRSIPCFGVGGIKTSRYASGGAGDEGTYTFAVRSHSFPKATLHRKSAWQGDSFPTFSSSPSLLTYANAHMRTGDEGTCTSTRRSHSLSVRVTRQSQYTQAHSRHLLHSKARPQSLSFFHIFFLSHTYARAS